MAPLPTLLTSLLTPTTSAASLTKRYYYYSTYNSGALIAGIVISVIFLLLAIISIILRCKYGYTWYGRRYNTNYAYTAPSNTAYNGAYVAPPAYNANGAGYYGPGAAGGARQWPGQQNSSFPAPSQVGEDGTPLNAYGRKRGPGTYQPPPMYGGPGGMFAGQGVHGEGTSEDPVAEGREVRPGRPSRLQDHAALRR